jgi:hypothetical protein
MIKTLSPSFTIQGPKETKDDSSVIPSSLFIGFTLGGDSEDDDHERGEDENKSSLQVSSSQPETETTASSTSPITTTITKNKTPTSSPSMSLSFEDLITELKETPVIPTQKEQSEGDTTHDLRSRTTLSDSSLSNASNSLNTLSSTISSQSRVSTFNTLDDSSSSSSKGSSVTTSSPLTMTTKSINQSEISPEQQLRPSSTFITTSSKIKESPVILKSGVIMTRKTTVSSQQTSMKTEKTITLAKSRISESTTTTMTMSFPEEGEDPPDVTADSPPFQILVNTATTLSSLSNSSPPSSVKTTESADDIANSFWKSLLPETTIMTTNMRDGNNVETEFSSFKPTPPLPHHRFTSTTVSSINKTTETSTVLPSSSTYSTTTMEIDASHTISTKIDNKAPSSNKEHENIGHTLASTGSKEWSSSTQSDRDGIHSTLDASSSNQTREKTTEEVTSTLHPLNGNLPEEDGGDFRREEDSTNNETPTPSSLIIPSRNSTRETSKVSISPSFSETPSMTFLPSDSKIHHSSSYPSYSNQTPSSSVKETTIDSSFPPSVTAPTHSSGNNNNNCSSTHSIFVPASPISTTQIPPISTRPLSPVNETHNSNESSNNSNIFGVTPRISFTNASGEVISLDWLPFALIAISFILILVSWIFGFVVCRKNRRLRRELATSLTSELMSTKIHMPDKNSPSNCKRSLSSSNWRMVSTPALIHHPIVMTPVTGTSSTSYTTTSSSMQSIPTLDGSSNKKSRKNKDKDNSEFEYVSFCHHRVESSVASSPHPHLHHYYPTRVLTTASIAVNGNESPRVNRSVERLLISPERLPVAKERTSLHIHRLPASSQSPRVDLTQQNNLNVVSLESRRAVDDLQRFFEKQVQDQSESEGKRVNRNHSKRNKKAIKTMRSDMTSSGAEQDDDCHHSIGDDSEGNITRRITKVGKSTHQVKREKVVDPTTSHRTTSSYSRQRESDQDSDDKGEESHEQLYCLSENMSSYISRNMIDGSSSHDRDSQVNLSRHLPADLDPSTKTVVQEVRRELHKFDSTVNRKD